MLPSGTKSLSLSNELQRGPALIAFINAEPLSSINYHYTVVCTIVTQVHLLRVANLPVVNFNPCAYYVCFRLPVIRCDSLHSP